MEPNFLQTSRRSSKNGVNTIFYLDRVAVDNAVCVQYVPYFGILVDFGWISLAWRVDPNDYGKNSR